MKYIALGSHLMRDQKYTGYSAIVDDDDYEMVNQYNWSIRINHSYPYALRNLNGNALYLHRFLAGNPKGVQILHINSNSLDNRRGNLSIFVKEFASMRGYKRNKRSSRYIGVHDRHTKNNPWVATILVDDLLQYLGAYPTEKAAAAAYNDAAINFFGETTVLNII